MKDESQNSLLHCLILAVSQCRPELKEEEGGFILKSTSGDTYEFHKIRNMNTGTPIARGLYTVDRTGGKDNEYATKILRKTNVRKPEWVEYASFHTHPKGFGPYPSQIDLTQLFTSSPVNFIYSPDVGILMRYDYNKEKNQWLAKQINLN